jgi:short-subunit dehydrogenase involved in D-alanine esterification of teichoic acids
MKLKSNTFLITGGASGIGYELTKQLTALGNTILITGRDQAKMDRAKAAFPKIHTFQSATLSTTGTSSLSHAARLFSTSPSRAPSRPRARAASSTTASAST